MGGKYYAGDISLMTDIVKRTSEEAGSIARRLVSIGTNINSFTGQTADSVKERYAVHYRSLMEEQVNCGQDALSAIQICQDRFQEIDHGNAVIYDSRLENNSAYLKGVLDEASGGFDSYNQILNSISHTGADLIRLSTERIENLSYDERQFSDQLQDKLKMADFVSKAAIKNAGEQYMLLMMHLLDMFDSPVQVQLINMMDGKISPSSLKFIKENLEAENERRRLLLYLETDKEAIMAELGIETEEAYAEYVKGVMLTLELWQEYRDKIDEFNVLSFDDKLEKYPLGADTPLSEFIFLVQLIEIDDLRKRKEILAVCAQTDGKITDKDINRILHTDIKGLFDMRATVLNTMYSSAKAGLSMPEFMKLVAESDRQRLNQVVMFGMTPYVLGYQAEYANPKVSSQSLNPNIRLDKLELDAQKGFGSFDYVPISWDSIKKTGVPDKRTNGVDSVTDGGKSQLQKIRDGELEIQFDERTLRRMGEDTGPYHNVPLDITKKVLNNEPCVIRPDGTLEFVQKGYVNGVEGVFHVSYKDGVITHQFFNSKSDWGRFSNKWGLPSWDLIQ